MEEKKFKIVAKKDRKFFSWLIDFVLSILIGTLLYFALGLPIAKSNFNYDQKNEAVTTLRKEMNSLVEEAKLIEYNDSKEEKTLNEYTKSYFEAKNNNVDNFAYYYLEYRNNLFDNHYDVSWFNQNILGLPANLSETNTSKCFDFAKNDKGEKDLSLVGVIKESDNFKKYLEEFYKGNIIDQTAKAYENLSDWFLKTLNSARADLATSKTYSEKLENYKILQKELSSMYSYPSIISYVVALLITYLIFPLIEKNNRTLGMIIAKLSLESEGNEKDSKLNVLLRGILNFVIHFGFYSILASFSIGFLFASSMPFMNIFIGSINALTFLLFSLIVLLINVIFIFFSKKESSLVDTLSKTYISRK